MCLTFGTWGVESLLSDWGFSLSVNFLGFKEEKKRKSANYLNYRAKHFRNAWGRKLVYYSRWLLWVAATYFLIQYKNEVCCLHRYMCSMCWKEWSNCLLYLTAKRPSYHGRKLYVFTICTKYAISYCLTVVLTGRQCDSSVTQTWTQRVVGWSPCLRQYPIFHNVGNCQSALQDGNGSAAHIGLHVTQLRSMSDHIICPFGEKICSFLMRTHQTHHFTHALYLTEGSNIT